MLNVRKITSTCIYLAAIQGAYAQLAPSTADVLKNIEQSKQELNRHDTKPASKKTPPPATSSQDIALLHEIRVQSPLLQEELMRFWLHEINKPVSAQKLNEFKSFAWDLFQNQGYLAYINTDTINTPNGGILTVNVALPKIAKVSVIAADKDVGSELIDEVLQRFSNTYKPGMSVDIQGFENQLSAATYDLPVDLEISLQQANATDVNLVIHLRKAHAQTGKVLGGVVQANNYGLNQFGQAQILGNVRVAGFTPSSELTLTTQQSDGVAYYRADYELPLVGQHSRLRVFSSRVKSAATNSKGLSYETGVGTSSLIQADRHGRWLASTELTRRETKSEGSEVITSDRVDQQLRLKLRAESANKWVENFNNEFQLVIGHMNLDRVNSDKLDDASGLKVAGSYQKIEMAGALSQALDRERIYTGSIRWKAQIAAKNLDGYNRISLGGINGIRAYTSIDGVGDQGAHMSFDIIHQVAPDVFGGLFYDVGVVKNSHTPLSNATDTGAYVLQGAGWQVGGRINQYNWTLSTAHAFGKTPGPGVWTAANTKSGDFRVNFAVTRPF
jgi:hemolysin activation/secretion protein